MTFRRVTISDQDILDLEAAMKALYRAHANAEAINLGVKILRWRGEGGFLACDIDESAGLAEVVELHGWSKQVPCA